MTTVPRGLPQPIPAIHPLPEYLAEGKTKARYEDMKAVLQVPWMGVVTMAYAHYPNFFDALWDGLRPVCGSAAYVEGARALRAQVEAGVATLEPPPIADRLTAMDYAPRELAQIRAMVEVFSHGNFHYLTIAAMAAWLLHGGALSDERAATPFEGRHAPEAEVAFLLMEAHHADAPTKALYEDIKATLDLPFVNTDYRALARWPSYFAAAWGDLKSRVGGSAHEAVARAAHDGALDLARTLPNPAGLSAARLQEAAAKDAPLAEIVAVARLFFFLLPGLVTNVAFFRHQLMD
jgi:hypothetical protein